MDSSDLMESNVDDSNDKLTTSDFLEFLKISCQLNKIISNDSNSWDKNSFDYSKLVMNVVMRSLAVNPNKKKHGEAVISNGNGAFSINKRVLHPILEGKLDRILKEGILDSIIPFMCPLQPPIMNVPNVKPLKTKHRDVSQSPRVGGLQLLNSSVTKSKNEQILSDSDKSIAAVHERHNKRRKSSISATPDDKKIE